MTSIQKLPFAFLLIMLFSCQNDGPKIKAIQQENTQKQKTIEEQNRQISRLEQRLEALEAKSSTPENASPSAAVQNSSLSSTKYYFTVLEVTVS